MTVQNSKNNRFMTYYLYRLGRLKYLMILLMLFMLLSFPLYSLFIEGYAAETLETDVEVYSNTFQVICSDLGWKIFAAGMLGALVIALIMGLDSFRYLHNKKYVNMDLSLPVTHRQRFFGDLLATVTAQFVPVLMAAVIGLSVCAHVRSIDYTGVYPSDTTPYYLQTCAQLENTIPATLVAGVLLIAMSLFVISFCGRTAIAVIMTVVTQIAVPIITTCLWTIGLSGAYGADEFSLMNSGFTSLISTTGYLFARGMSSSHQLLNNSPWGYIFIAVWSAALIAGAYFVQKHRRNERTGEPFVFKYARHGFTALFILAVASFFGMRLFAPEYAKYTFFYSLFGGGTGEKYDIPFAAICVVSALLIFIIMEVIGGGSLKKAPVSAARFLVTVGACLGLCAAFPVTGCFGFSTYIPSENVADSAYVSFHNHWDSPNQFIVPYEEAAALHRRIINEHPGSASLYRYGSVGVSIQYIGKNSVIASRSYELNDSYIKDLYDMYFRNNGMARRYEKPEYQGSHERDETGRWVTKTYELTRSFAFVYTTNKLPADEAAREKYMIKADIDPYVLYDTIMSDIENVTYEQMYLSAYQFPATIHLHVERGEDIRSPYNLWNMDYRIYPFFTNTIALLKENGLVLFPDNEPDYSAYEAYIVRACGNENEGHIENTPSLYSDLQVVTGDPSLGGNMRRLGENSAELKELMGYTAEMSYYGGNERYYIVLIDKKYGDLTRSVYRYPVIEAYTARAAEIFAAAPEAREELENLRDHGTIYSLEEMEVLEEQWREQN